MMFKTGTRYLIDNDAIISGPNFLFDLDWQQSYPPEDDGWFSLWVDAPTEEQVRYADLAAVVWNPAEQRVETSWSPEQHREDIRSQIERQRQEANRVNVDLRADAGRNVLMDEANAEAERQSNRLDSTADADLATFDATFDPLQIGSLATAQSAYEQEQYTLTHDASLTVDQVSDLEAARDTHRAVVQAGDDAADVAAVPESVRLKVGVVAEGFGTLKSFRRWDGVFWHLSFELLVDRELSVDDYWMAVYTDDGSTYLGTPQLTKVSEGKYVADEQAVNLQGTRAYQYTLAYQHISNPQFELQELPENENAAIHLVRWGGNASGPTAGSQSGDGGAQQWEDTGQTVLYIGAQLIRVGSTAAFAVGDVLRLNERPALYTVTAVHSSIDLLLDAQPPAEASGDTVYRKS